MIFYSAEQIAALAANLQNLALFVQFDFRPSIINIWTGARDIAWGGRVWKPTGQFGSVAPIKSTGELRADGLAFTLSNIPITSDNADLLAVADQYARQGGQAELWLGWLDGAGAIIGNEPISEWRGSIDVPFMTDDGTTASITINCENDLAILQRAPGLRYTDESHRASYPDDLGLGRIAQLQQKAV